VRNADGGFFLCQAGQNIYRTSKKISIQWFGDVAKEDNPEGDLFFPEYYDKTDFEAILTSVELEKAPAGKPASASDATSSDKKASSEKRFQLPKKELERIERLLQRSKDKEEGKEVEEAELKEDNPDGRE